MRLLFNLIGERVGIGLGDEFHTKVTQQLARVRLGVGRGAWAGDDDQTALSRLRVLLQQLAFGRQLHRPVFRLRSGGEKLRLDEIENAVLIGVRDVQVALQDRHAHLPGRVNAPHEAQLGENREKLGWKVFSWPLQGRSHFEPRRLHELAEQFRQIAGEIGHFH